MAHSELPLGRHAPEYPSRWRNEHFNLFQGDTSDAFAQRGRPDAACVAFNDFAEHLDEASVM